MGKMGQNWPDLEKEKENPNHHGFMISYQSSIYLFI
jgi:hypothetical protein